MISLNLRSRLRSLRMSKSSVFLITWVVIVEPPRWASPKNSS